MAYILFDHLAERDLISGVQWGFCPGRSTVTALVSTFHHIFQLLENGLDVSLVFFDIRKAFDSVPHLPLLQKLKDINLNQHILQWISSYLFNRQQRVVVDGATSTATPVLSGVPQGSVQGLCCFSSILTTSQHFNSPMDPPLQCMLMTFFSLNLSVALRTMVACKVTSIPSTIALVLAI